MLRLHRRYKQLATCTNKRQGYEKESAKFYEREEKKSAVDYKENLEKAIGIEKIRTSLKENGLAETIFTANETDVIQILDDRRRQMASEIRDFYKTL